MKIKYLISTNVEKFLHCAIFDSIFEQAKNEINKDTRTVIAKQLANKVHEEIRTKIYIPLRIAISKIIK